jgi:hypothetical protein
MRFNYTIYFISLKILYPIRDIRSDFMHLSVLKNNDRKLHNYSIWDLEIGLGIG